MMHRLPSTLGRLAAAALTAAAVSFAAPALAQNAANGKLVFEKTIVTGIKSCLSCHGTAQEDPVLLRGVDANRIKGAVMSQAKMTPLNGFITDAEFNDMAAYLAGEYKVTGTYIPVSAAPSPSVSPTALTFASQNINTTSAAQTITVSNAAGAADALKLTSLGITSGSDYSVFGGTCAAGSSVAAGANCTITVVFRPTAVGARSGTLSIAHNGAGGKTDVALSGTAVNTSPAITVSPSTLTFSSVVNVDSTTMRATVSNTGTGALSLSALTLGGAQAADYRLASSSTCAANGSVAGGSSCVIDVVFKPGATGARNGTLSIAHNAVNSPSTVTLAGTGTLSAEPGIALDATTLDLGNQVVGTTSTAKTITLTNSGGAALSITGVSASGTDSTSFVLGGTCTAGSSVASRGTCTITVALKALTLGAKTATLNVTTNAPSGAATVALRGTAVNTPAPEVGLSQAAVGFGNVTIGTTTAGRTVTLTNTGTAALTVSGIASSSTEYVASHNCPASLAAAAACTVTIVYKPATDNSAESVIITTNALSSPNSIVVTGQGVTTALPVLAWQSTATSLTFASTVVGVGSASQTLTLVNKGPGAVTLTSLGMAGANATSFAVAAASTCKVGLALAVDGTCTVTISFVPGETGLKTANLQVGSTGTPPADIALSGTGASPSSSTGTVSVSTSTLDFSSIGATTGTTSAPLSLTVSNSGTAAVAISSIKVTGSFAIQAASTGGCSTGASSLAAGASCLVSVVYTPTAAGASTGTLTIATATQNVEVALKGQATASTPKLAWPANATSWQFPSTVTATTSAVQTRTLTNQGPGSVTLSAVSFGGTDAASFALSSTSTCKAGTAIAAGATCNVAVTFSPSTAGSKSATLRVESNGTSPGEIALSGSGMAPSTTTGLLTADKAQLDFTTPTAIGQMTAPLPVVITNGNVAAVTVSKTEVAGPFRVITSTCGSTIAVSANCTISLAFVPTANGTAVGTLMVTTGSGQVLTVSLSGLTTSTAPVLAWKSGSATTLAFGNTVVGNSATAKTLVLENQGSSTVTFTGIGTDGTDKAAFVVGSESSCKAGGTLAQGASCIVSISFRPTAAGAQTATVLIASNGSAPATVTLSGTGTAADVPGGSTGSLGTDSTSLSFVGALGTPSASKTVVVKNSGSSAVAISSIDTSGPFQVVNSASGGCGIGQSLAAGATCEIALTFSAPATAGTTFGTLTVSGGADNTLTVALSGQAMSTNAGNTDDEEGGGAIDPLALALAGLLLAAWALAQRRRAQR